MGKRKHDAPEALATQKQSHDLPLEKPTLSKKHRKVEGQNQEFKRVTIRINVTLPPCYAQEPNLGVRLQLNRFLLRYIAEVDGVVLGFTDVQLQQRSARIMYDSPFAHFWVTTTLLVWRPSIGMMLTGTTNLQSRDHIGLLLHGTFSASIPSSLIPKDRYRWQDKPKNSVNTEEEEETPTSRGQWISRETNQPLGGETNRVNFSVAEVITANMMLTVVGTLLDRIDEVDADADATAGLLQHISGHGDESEDKKNKKKKKKQKHEASA